jgi:hypothetical protein
MPWIHRRTGRARITAVVLVGIFILSSCSSPGPADKPGPKPSLKSGTHESTATVDSLKLTIKVGRTQYQRNQPVPLRLVVANNSSKRIDLKFPSSKTHDFQIIDNHGREIWRWSAGKVFAQAFVERQLGSGEDEIYTAQWNQKDNDNKDVSPGKYRVKADFLAVGRSKGVGPLTIEIIP